MPTPDPEPTDTPQAEPVAEPPPAPVVSDPALLDTEFRGLFLSGMETKEINRGGS
jgi:hypothetical protein